MGVDRGMEKNMEITILLLSLGINLPTLLVIISHPLQDDITGSISY